MEGEKSITDLVNFSQAEKKKKNKRKVDSIKLSDQKTVAKKRALKRQAIVPNECMFISSPLDCLNTVLKKNEAHEADIHSMCISFILKNISEISIKGNSSVEIQTNHIFKKYRIRKNNKKMGVNCKKKLMEDLDRQLGYHLTVEGHLAKFGLVLDPRQSMFQNNMDKQFIVNIFNFNSEDVILPPKTNICKIYFYVLKNQAQEEN